MPFTIVRNDITAMAVDVIVNTANPRPIVGLGMDSAIHKKAGPKLLAARQKIGTIERGCTALLDAVGKAIHHIGNVHKYAREEDRPEKTLFIITTDGMENASREYSYERVKMMIERQKEKYSWEFLFLGANIDAAKEAARFGIRADRAANYHADSQGTAAVYETVSAAITHVRGQAAPLAADWKEAVDKDFKTRQK